MFRRSSKLTAVLVAAASITSAALPAVQAVASERLGTKDGNITTARAFEGGYVFDGYKTDDDDAALYYNNGDKDKEIDENEDYDNYQLKRYGEKYATVKDGNDEYLVDLSTGKIDDDENIHDKKNDAESKVRSKISKEDRYSNFKDENIADKKFASFEKILNDKYGEVWYKYSAAGDKDAFDRTTDSSVEYNGKKYDVYQGFTNDSGKYIDVSQIANMYVYDEVNKKTVKIEEYGDTKNNLKLKLVDVKALTQDKDYIYTLTKVKINDKDEQYFFQKISKAQGEKQDGAYLPKSVVSYQIDDKSIYNDDDMKTAYNLIVNDNDGDNHKVVNYEVDSNFIYVTTVNEGDNEKANVKVYKLKFKKDKIDSTNKEKVDTYIVKKDDDADHDTVSRQKKGGLDVENSDVYSIDKDGNTWILDKGKIYKVDGTDFKEVYTCDRSLNRLDVYDEKNLIAWCSEGDVYTTVSEGKKQAVTDAGETTDTTDNKDNTNTTTTTTEAQVGWVKNADSTWSYYKDGAKATGWLQDGSWYYLDAAGIMKTGWQQVGGLWYYLNGSGAMQTGWVNDNGTWYYCNASGAMLENQWFQDSDGRWYYLQASGAMAVNTVIGGYVIGANGAWVK